VKPLDMKAQRIDMCFQTCQVSHVSGVILRMAGESSMLSDEVDLLRHQL